MRLTSLVVYVCDSGLQQDALGYGRTTLHHARERCLSIQTGLLAIVQEHVQHAIHYMFFVSTAGERSQSEQLACTAAGCHEMVGLQHALLCILLVSENNVGIECYCFQSGFTS
jgi:hypothetical protein